MPDISVRVRVLRERAEELRTIAEDWSSQETQRMLIALATDYERIANALEQKSSSRDHDGPQFVA